MLADIKLRFALNEDYSVVQSHLGEPSLMNRKLYGQLPENDETKQTVTEKKISGTTSVIENFGSAIEKLRIDGAIFKKHIIEIERSIYDITDNVALAECKLNTRKKPLR